MLRTSQAPETIDDWYEADDIAEPRSEGVADVARQVGSALYRSRLLIAIVVALALAAGVASILLTPAKYQARASLQIEQQATRVLGTEDVDPQVSNAEADRFLQTQVDILQSRSLAGRVAEGLALDSGDRFLTAMGARAPDNADRRARREQAIQLLQRNFRVEIPSNSRVVELAFTSRDPEFAAQIVNRYSEAFIAANIQRRFSTSNYSREFLQNQLSEARQRLEATERAQVAYARETRLIDVSAGLPNASSSQAQGPRSATTLNLVQMNQAFAAAQAARVQAQERWAQTQATPLLSLPEVVTNSAIQQLAQNRAQISARLDSLRVRYDSEHPSLAQARAELSEAERQMTVVASSIRDSIRAQYTTALRQEVSLRVRVAGLQNETLSEQDRGVRYNILHREVETNRQLYDALLNRFREVSASSGVIANNITPVDNAEVPRVPISPRPALNLALAGFGGLILALLLVAGRELLDDTIRRPEELETKLGVPLLGAVPRLKDAAPAAALRDDTHGLLAEAYQTISASIELSSAAGVPPSLLITSSRKGEGKSTSAYALAHSFASTGRKTLLIDADLRSPSQHDLFDLPRAPGLTNVLAGAAIADAAIQPTPAENLFVLPAGAAAPNPAQLTGSAELKAMLSGLQPRFDVIILDGPPMLALADAPQLAAAVDATILVVEANAVHFGQAKRVVRRLRSQRTNLLGAILTKFDAKAMGYRGDIAYYGYSAYGKDEKN
jgi:capsular exopolysaccharide synthesis family protein